MHQPHSITHYIYCTDTCNPTGILFDREEPKEAGFTQQQDHGDTARDRAIILIDFSRIDRCNNKIKAHIYHILFKLNGLLF